MPKRYGRGWSGGSGRSRGYVFDSWQNARVTPAFVPRYLSIREPQFKVHGGSGNDTLASLRSLLADGADYVARISPTLSIAGVAGHCEAPAITGVPARPTAPTKGEDLPRPPRPELDQFPVEISRLDKLLFWRAKEKAEEVQQKYKRALLEWEFAIVRAKNADSKHSKHMIDYEGEVAKWNARYAPVKAEFDRVLRAFEDNKKNLEQTIADDERHFAELLKRGAKGDPTGYVEHVLTCSPYPAEFPHEVSCRYDSESRYLIAEIELPDCRQIVDAASQTAKPKPTKAQRESLIEETPLALIIRVMREIAAADHNDLIETIVVNGKLFWHDPASGQARHEVIASVQALKEKAALLELATLRPKECFRMLRGAISTGLSSGHVEPVIPFLKIEKDGRIVAARDILDELPPDSNLAEMPWEDFEHLIREVFAKEFASTGAEVNVTRASRDWGVDALIQDPDPIRGGKFVVQAKRYTNVVGVDAVRDLFGTVMNEGANRGILVTTSHFGPQSREFAKGKPLTLIDGAGLLAMLERHGYKYSIRMT